MANSEEKAKQEALQAATDTTSFDLPVDLENKACAIKLLSFTPPHMRAFHLMWFSFFISFVSTFAAAPLIVIIRDDLDMTKTDLGYAGIAAVTGTIFCRIAMGSVCDMVGPRYGHAILMLSTAPAVFGMALVEDAAGFTAARCVIGFSLATFVATQFWSSVMFTPKLIGVANATTAGWGNLGGGVTNLVMPFIFLGINNSIDKMYVSWRWAYFVPGWGHILVGLLVLLLSQDLPEGNYADLKKKGTMAQEDGMAVFLAGCANYRMWCLTITYGYCFGVELTMNNIVAPYLFDQFDLNLQVAGLLGSLFGLMNIFARSLGGLGSDVCAKHFGMRGRLWCLFLMQVAEGFLCICMGQLYETLPGTIFVMILFSLFVQMSEGASYGVVPYVSKRALGVVSGFVGAGGNAGSSVTQRLFFATGEYETYEGISYMGVMVICMTLLIIPIHFPMWGGMFFGPKEGATEEEYYMSDFSEEERKQGLADVVLKFATNSRSERGEKAAAELVEKEGARV